MVYQGGPFTQQESFFKPQNPMSKENTAFEDALVIFPEDIPEPERWEKVAALVPRKSPAEVREHYRVLVHDLMEIEAGRVSLLVYSDDIPLYSDACDGGSYINADGVLTHWTLEQNTAFEDALVIFPEDLPEPERWEKVAALVPGKSPAEVREHYRVLVHDLMEIEAGRVPLPLYSDDLPPVQVKNNSGTHRKKGVAWTEEEHK
ncbi:transcription factor SRM1-like [Gastrolobium bilobum]|uniref:transcription factor SRM1-like n=1 Tax=Gastrolobium bilobum TaxID=150636 RepID=UPI002AB25FD0|nr:transcription factor SRM1-like [Gastrolobium bilobum]